MWSLQTNLFKNVYINDGLFVYGIQFGWKFSSSNFVFPFIKKMATEIHL